MAFSRGFVYAVIPIYRVIPTPAPSPLTNASFSESILAPGTPETLSPEFPET